MKLLDVVHPAAKTLVEIAKSQDAEVILNSLLCSSSLSSCSQVIPLPFHFPKPLHTSTPGW